MSEPFVPTWRDIALCREVDPELFFVAPGGNPRPAKRICAACPVRTACLDEALSYPGEQDYGIRGGLSRDQRVVLRRSARTASVTPLPLPVVASEQPRKAAA